jgi:hypothetical protein
VPTNTEPPPQGSCSDIDVSWAGIVEFDIRNEYGSPIILTKIELTWDDTDTDQLKQVKLGGAAIAAGNLGRSPTTLTLNDDASKRTINNNDTKTLAFAFMNAPVADGYTVKLTFDVGCTRSASH